MAFAGIDHLAVVAAAVAGLAFGSAWYMALGKAWQRALGKSEGQGKAMPVVPMIIAGIAQLVMAYMLAGVLGHLGEGQVTPVNGLMGGALVWLGFVLTSLVVNHAFQGAKRALTAIDGGHWLGVLLVQGLVIGLFGV